uniref:Peptidase S1 domain-containing protein n=1 Tax=Parascaris univalens TaxID=6257 RepID=A0A915BT32_PARUN
GLSCRRNCADSALHRFVEEDQRSDAGRTEQLKEFEAENGRGGNDIQRSLRRSSERERKWDKHGSAKDCHTKAMDEGATEKAQKEKKTEGVNKRTFVNPSFGPFIEHLERPMQGQMIGDFLAFSVNQMLEGAPKPELERAMACGPSKCAISYRHNFTIVHSFVLPRSASLPLQVAMCVPLSPQMPSLDRKIQSLLQSLIKHHYSEESEEADLQRLSALLDATYVEARSIVTPLVMRKENISVTDLRRLTHAISEQIRIDEKQIMDSLNRLRSLDVISMSAVSKLRNALLDRLASRRSATLSVYDLQKAVDEARKQ